VREEPREESARGRILPRGTIDEAAWMAISFGGSPTMMFYRIETAPSITILNTNMTNLIEKLLPGIFGASSNSPCMGADGKSLA
jgi:hypothetical protein